MMAPDRLLLMMAAVLALAGTALAQGGPRAADPLDRDLAVEMAQALQDQRAAESRSRQWEAAAREAATAAEQAAAQAAALAARVQQAEAGIRAAQARIEQIDRERAELEEAIGRAQQPVVRVAAALQQFARRPVALAMLRPGSVRDLVHLRAMLEAAAPQVARRTAGLRAQLASARALRLEAEQAMAQRAAEERALAERRRQLTEIETRQRLAARAAGSQASREAARALALAEQLRDLDALMSELDRAARLRARLAALPGPQLRPASFSGGSAAATGEAAPGPSPALAGQPPRPYMLPVSGRMVAGFGVPQPGGRSTGITLAPLAGAQVVAPGAGRVVFAGPFRGYGVIVIIEHPAGWTSLVTGLARADAAVGDTVAAGAPLGVAGPGRPTITLELRRAGEPVNPLAQIP